MGVREPRPARRRGSVPHLIKFAWTPIVRHQLVTGAASPDDPDLVDYWATRRRRVKPPLDSYNLRLLTRQAGSLSALPRPPAHRRPAAPVPTGMGTLVAERGPQGDRRRLPRPPGRARHAGREPNPLDTRLLPPRAPSPQTQEASTTTRNALAACLSRVRRRVARTVLRGPRRSNAPRLPDSAIGTSATRRPTPGMVITSSTVAATGRDNTSTRW